MKFAVFTDLHYDSIHDGDRRMRELIKSVKKENVDFVIELGDLCYPTEENKHIITKVKELGVPCFFNVGNHNSDAYPIDVVLKFLGIENGHYSFVFGNVKFIVINANYIKTPNGSEPYYRRNYDKTTDTYPYVPKEEIEWLKNEIKDDRFYYVIFSHQSLSNNFMKRGISNRQEIRAILEKRNSNGKKVLF